MIRPWMGRLLITDSINSGVSGEAEGAVVVAISRAFRRCRFVEIPSTVPHIHELAGRFRSRTARGEFLLASAWQDRPPVQPLILRRYTGCPTRQHGVWRTGRRSRTYPLRSLPTSASTGNIGGNGVSKWGRAKGWTG